MADTKATYRKPSIKKLSFELAAMTATKRHEGAIEKPKTVRELLKALCALGIAAKIEGPYLYIPDPRSSEPHHYLVVVDESLIEKRKREKEAREAKWAAQGRTQYVSK